MCFASDLYTSLEAHITTVYTYCDNARYKLFNASTMPELEAAEIECLDILMRVEKEAKEIDILLQQADVRGLAELLRSLPDYEQLSVEKAHEVVGKYLDYVMVQFRQFGPMSLAKMRKIVTEHVKESG
ncbi:hypothetical protein N0V90_002827 [Kalmusia sp. IMI 367209]|nr:hypothetical protein N0V90_002827 [Kalmusia sp. IMI 367209]